MTYYHHYIIQIRHMELLNKCWLGFVIAKDKEEWDKLDMYARRIQKYERQLGRQVTDFSNWGVISKNQYQT